MQHLTLYDGLDEAVSAAALTSAEGPDDGGTRVWGKLLRLPSAVVPDVWMGDSGELVVIARPNLEGARTLRDL